MTSCSGWYEFHQLPETCQVFDDRQGLFYFSERSAMFAFAVILSLFAVNVMTPGASFIMTISNAMSHGRKTGYMIALGLAAADIMFATAAAFGLAAVIAHSSLMVRCISLFGGLWLLYGGVRLMMKRKNAQLMQEAEDTPGALSASLAFRMGFTTGALNAQAIIFFATMFVASLSTEPSLALSLGLVLGVALVSAGIRTTMVRLFTVGSLQSRYTAHRRKAETVAGGALAFFGAKLAAAPALFLLKGAL
jgi:threonine/homoserine/homoserine lactone efflux protein